ncbi:MAG: M42 family peptidase, partial [Pirellulaceae bacterium]
MEAAPFEFFRKLLDTPSPSGYERPIQDVVRKYVGSFADEVRTDLHGNVIASKNPGAKLRVMFAGHCDQIGMVVTHVNDNGFIYAQTIGGWDAQQLIGQRMVIWTT